MEQEWLLLDMHLHSGYSKTNKPDERSRVKDMSAKEFVDTLSNKGVRIFSITDHNYFSKKYYEKIEQYIKSENLSMKIINGVEMDVYVDLNNNTENCIHICFYFDDNVNRDDLELAIKNLYDKTNKDGKPRFNDIMSEFFNLKTKIIAIPHGDKERGLFKNNLINDLNFNELPEFYKYAMYKIFNAFDVKLKFDDKSNNFWATNFYEHTNSFNELIDNKNENEIIDLKKRISNKIKDNSITLNEEDQEIYDYIMRYGSYFAYFTFSDWHNKENYDPKINNFIFGSIPLAFSSFEMATLDPVSRIVKSKDNNIEIPTTLLKKISFKINGKSKEVSLSPGLNAIVGKRGSGKTLLLSVIKNLAKSDDSNGALSLYKDLTISDISATDRGGIQLSLGSLNSVAFLTQSQIVEIFENPALAEMKIANNFSAINGLDISGIKEISSIGSKIKQYNFNFKNVTSNILSIKKLNNYNYTEFNAIDDIEIKSNFTNINNELDTLIENVKNQHLDTHYLDIQKKNLEILKEYYLFLISSYNKIIANNSIRIAEFNSKQSNNQITIKQNLIDIDNAINMINDNFINQLYIEKNIFAINNFKIENPPVEVNIKGKYLFATYYDIENNIRELLEDKILNTVARAPETITGIRNYAKGEKKLKASYTTIVDELNKSINGDTFKAKREFFEIKNSSVDYKEKIKTMNDLNRYLSSNDIVSLSKASPGTKSVAYLDMLFDLDEKILILDQPEDNIDNDYISNYLVPNIKKKKKIKQLIFVTHNPSVAVYGDAFNYIYVENNDEINYKNYLIERREDKDALIKILEGGRQSFSNRNKKFGNILGDDEYEVN